MKQNSEVNKQKQKQKQKGSQIRERVNSNRPKGMDLQRVKYEGLLNGDVNIRRSQQQQGQSDGNAGMFCYNDIGGEENGSGSNANKIMELIQTFKIKQISTKSYKVPIYPNVLQQIIQQIAQSFTTLDNLTLRLQQKVDLMLKQQQHQFVSSYINHMKKIKQQFSSVDKKIQQYQKKIKYYQNQGQMSHLVIKVAKLQQQCKKLYKEIFQRDKVVKDNQLTIKVQKSELKRYEKEIKFMMREKNQMMLKIEEMEQWIKGNGGNGKYESDRNNNKQTIINDKQSITLGVDYGVSQREVPVSQFKCQQTKNVTTLFPTELIDHYSSNHHHNQKNTHDLSTQYHFGSNQSRPHLLLGNKSSQKSLTLDFSLQKTPKNNPNSQHQLSLLTKVRQMQLKKQVSSLKKRNKLLNSFQSYVLDAKTDMQSFFIQCVNELKQQIRIRKKINYCTFDQFKKEDKIELLIKVISNDDILGYLYERIFKKKRLFGGNTNQEKGKQRSEQKLSDNQGAKQKNNGLSLMSSDRINNRSLQKLISKNHLVNNSPSTTSDMKNIFRFEIGVKQKQKLKTSQRQDIRREMNVGGNGGSVINYGDSSKQRQKEKERQQGKKSLSMAKRRFSKHISQNTLLPKIHFHLQY